MLHDTCEWLVQGYGMERGAKDTWQSAVATWNGISVPLFPLLGSAAEEDGVPIVPRSWQKAWAHLRPWTPHFKPYERALVWSVASKAASVPMLSVNSEAQNWHSILFSCRAKQQGRGFTQAAALAPGAPNCSSCYRLEIHWFGDPRSLDSWWRTSCASRTTSSTPFQLGCGTRRSKSCSEAKVASQFSIFCKFWRFAVLSWNLGLL